MPTRAEVSILDPEALEIRSMARDFASAEIRPHAAAWDADRRLPDAIFRELGELGFLGMGVPDALGGLGLDLPATLLALESLAWGDAALALAVSTHAGAVSRAILEHGSDAQRERWLPRLATGEVLGAVGSPEVSAGEEVQLPPLTARVEGDGWVLSGSPGRTRDGGRAGLRIVFARTGEGPGERTAFLVPGETEGVSEVRRERTLGFSAAETVILSFEEVRLSADGILGGEGGGDAVSATVRNFGRLGLAALATGIAQAAFEHAIRYAGEREQFGTSLSGFGAIQEKLAGMALRLEESRGLLLTTAARVQGRTEAGARGRAGAEGGGLHVPSSIAAAVAMAKVSASETAMWVTDEAVQIFGGYGYMRDYPVEKLMRDAKGTEIYEGTNERLRWEIARDLLAEGEGR